MGRFRLFVFLLSFSATFSAAAPLTQAQLIAPFPYEMIKLTPDIYAFVETARTSIVSSNIVAVIGGDSVLVFDSGHHGPVTKQIIGDLKKLTKKPVRYVVNSHWHDDHYAGNAEFADAWPGATFIAHRFTAQMLESQHDSLQGEPCKKVLNEQSTELRGMLDSGKRPDGSALSDKAKKFVAHALQEFDVSLVECDTMRFRGSDIAMDGSLDIDLGKRVVKLEFLGRANTAGDVIAYLPQEKVLLTGDVLVAPFPYATQSYIREWAEVLRKLEKYDAAIIVPGHGQPMRDKNYLADVRAVMESVSSQVHALYKPGVAVEDVRKQVDIAALRQKICGDDKFVLANFDNMVLQSAVERAYQEEAGALKPEGD